MPTEHLTLTDEFRRALGILDSGGNLFLTGKAGTGKSTLVRHFLAHTDRRVLVAAPTGIAALNVDGYTIHRLFGFRPTTTLEDVRDGTYRPGMFAKALKSLQTLVIDEASMVRADMFDKVVAALERYGPHPGTEFGGVQLVLVGDLLQLPPVVETALAEYFRTRYATPYFFSADRFSRDDFPTVALTTVFRQQGDQRMTSILNSIREGVLVEQARAELNSRTDPDFVAPDDEFWLTLAPTNPIVTARNRQRLEQLPGTEIAHRARATGDLATFDPPAEELLRFKPGAQIMMLSNDPADRWVNGTLGRILSVTDDTDGLQVTARFLNGSTAAFSAHTWEATRPSVVDGRLSHEVIGTWTQLPFRLAWAITIHKSQGQTLDRLVVDLSGGAFDYGQVYVALSRATSMDGLVLKRDVLAKDLRTDRRVLRFLRESTAPAGPRRYCAISILTIGEEGRMSRPRPVEIGVAFSDGTGISTLVNPQRDLGDARTAYGISVTDVLLAPTLPQAWAVLAPLLEGSTPVGVDADLTLGFVDFELKRLGRTVPLPLAVELPRDALEPAERRALASGRALDRARATLAVHSRLDRTDASASAFLLAEDEADDPGYLLTRDPQATPPTSAQTPTRTALLTAGRALSAAVLDGLPADGIRALPWMAGASLDDPLLARTVTHRLTDAAGHSAGLPSSLTERLCQVEDLLGQPLLEGLGCGNAGERIDEVLVPETRVCFTGTVCDPGGREVSKAELEELVVLLGLRWATNVSKTRCEALVVAEVGTQSGKARKAKEYGKPVFSAEEFFDWVERKKG